MFHNKHRAKKVAKAKTAFRDKFKAAVARERRPRVDRVAKARNARVLATATKIAKAERETKPTGRDKLKAAVKAEIAKRPAQASSGFVEIVKLGRKRRRLARVESCPGLPESSKIDAAMENVDETATEVTRCKAAEDQQPCDVCGAMATQYARVDFTWQRYNEAACGLSSVARGHFCDDHALMFKAGIVRGARIGGATRVQQ